MKLSDLGGARKAPETGHSVSPDPIREQWSMRSPEKRPHIEGSRRVLKEQGQPLPVERIPLLASSCRQNAEVSHCTGKKKAFRK